MHARQTTADRLAEAAELLCDRVDCLSFSRPVTHVYNPLRYAWDAHESYLRRFGDSRKMPRAFALTKSCSAPGGFAPETSFWCAM